MATKLRVVTPGQSGPQPPRKLGQDGAALWKTIMAEYAIIDSGGLEMLTQICAATDRLSELSEIIRRDGPVVRSKAGPREHPLLKAELATRAFIVRTLARLGLDVEPIKSVGRPPGFA